MTHQINKTDLLHEIANLAYVIADVSEGKETPHTLHQTYDICEDGNRSRVESLLTLAVAEAAAAMTEIGTLHIYKEKIVLKTMGVTKTMAVKVAALVHEYLTASVLHGWLSVTLPASADFWEKRKAEIMESLGEAVFTASIPLRAFPRGLPPI